jgi:lipopolysaccharide export system protein LptA
MTAMLDPRLRLAAWFATLTIAAMAMLCQDVLAQTQRGTRPRNNATARTTTDNVANPLQGFSQNRDMPVHIEAATLEVRDKEQIATFSGNVHVVQGDTDLRCDTLVVHYEQSDGDQAQRTVGSRSTAKPAATMPMEGQRIRRLEIKGNVIVTQKDQTATGDNGEFDMRSSVITLVGNVIVGQGKNVLRGDRLVVNLVSGVSRIESNSGRVQGLFQPSQQPGQNNAGPGAAGLVPRLN